MQYIAEKMEQIEVAPLVGAWIEINLLQSNQDCMLVAPLVGAWIEILFCIRSLYASLSLLL